MTLYSLHLLSLLIQFGLEVGSLLSTFGQSLTCLSNGLSSSLISNLLMLNGRRLSLKEGILLRFLFSLGVVLLLLLSPHPVLMRRSSSGHLGMLSVVAEAPDSILFLVISLAPLYFSRVELILHSNLSLAL